MAHAGHSMHGEHRFDESGSRQRPYIRPVNADPVDRQVRAGWHTRTMATRQRPVDAGTERGRAILAQLTREARTARRDRGLSLADVGRAVGLSQATMTRFEHGNARDIGMVRMSRILAVVGLQLGVRAYSGDGPLRDQAHVRLLGSLRDALHPILGWSLEVPLPVAGDRRAWDAVIRGPSWRYGVEAETHPTDLQALLRRIELKRRDGGLDGVVLLLPATRHVRDVLRGDPALLRSAFPVAGREALACLTGGRDPGGGSVIVMPRKLGT